MRATASLACCARGPSFDRHKIENLERIAEQLVSANLRPGVTQLQNSRPSTYSPLGAKLDDMSIAYGAYISGDYITALRIIEPLAEKGDVRAQYILGYMHENGHVADQDFALAAKWYRMAAEQGDAISEISLGLLYEHGKGVVKDLRGSCKTVPQRRGSRLGESSLSLGCDVQVWPGSAIGPCDGTCSLQYCSSRIYCAPGASRPRKCCQGNDSRSIGVGQTDCQGMADTASACFRARINRKPP